MYYVRCFTDTGAVYVSFGIFYGFYIYGWGRVVELLCLLVVAGYFCFRRFCFFEDGVGVGWAYGFYYLLG